MAMVKSARPCSSYQKISDSSFDYQAIYHVVLGSLDRHVICVENESIFSIQCLDKELHPLLENIVSVYSLRLFETLDCVWWNRYLFPFASMFPFPRQLVSFNRDELSNPEQDMIWRIVLRDLNTPDP